MGRLIGRSRFAPLVLAGALLGLAGCSGAAGGKQNTTSTLAGGVTTTSIVPVTVPGTTDGGFAAALGTVQRLPVMPVPAGHLTAEVPSPGSAAYAGVVPVAYRQLGSGPPLLLVPGEAASMSWWSPALLEQLAHHYQVTVFDLPGTGYSGAAASPLTIQWLADVSAGLAGELGLRSPAVLGWGLGGQVAVALAERHPGLASDLILVDTALPVPGARPMSARAARRFAAGATTVQSLANWLFPAGSTTPVADRHSWLRALDEQVPDSVTAPERFRQAEAERRFWQHAATSADPGSLHAHVLVVAGTDDAVFPPADGVAVETAIRGAQLYRWNGEGYGGLIGDPQQFASVIEQFTG